jgi:hypothetical protein
MFETTDLEIETALDSLTFDDSPSAYDDALETVWEITVMPFEVAPTEDN